MLSCRASRGAPNWLSASAAYLALGSLCACSGSAPGASPAGEEAPVAADDTGNVELALTLSGGGTISSFHFAVSGPKNFSRTGDVTVANSTRLTTTVNGIPSGTGYSLAITTSLDDAGTSCSGSATFDVTAGVMTDVPVLVTCKASTTTGSVLVNGSLNICPRIDSFNISPATANIGGTMDLTAFAQDFDGAPSTLTYTWTATDGTLANANTDHATFTCTKGGHPTISMSVSDGDPACSNVVSFPVNCSCQKDSDCGSTSACSTAACTAGSCTGGYVAANTVVAAPAGDCHQYHCDGSGNVVTTVSPIETPCDVGKVCDGSTLSTACQPIRIRVLRVGDGTTRTATAANPVFVDEYTASSSTPLSSIALPTTSDPDPGGNQPFTHALSDSSAETTDGLLSRSEDGHYLVLVGYAATLNTKGVVAQPTSTVKRVVARIDSAGVVDTSTVLNDAFDGLDARSAASLDGSGFWVGGGASSLTSNYATSGTPESGGIWYVPFRASGGVQLGGPLCNDINAGLEPNARVVRVFGGQLYCDAASEALTEAGLFKVGTGLPTTGTQTFTSLPGIPPPSSNTMNPFGFLMFDRDASVQGMDTLYVADGDTETGGSVGGIQKWTFDGTKWNLVNLFTQVTGAAGANYFRGLAGLVTYNNTVTLFATSAVPSAGSDSLVMFIDDGSSTVTGTFIVPSSGTNKVFRGVALPPHN